MAAVLTLSLGDLRVGKTTAVGVVGVDYFLQIKILI